MTFNRNLGAYDTKQEVWTAYPSGGASGDYVQIDGQIYGWSTASNDWVLALSQGSQVDRRRSQSARQAKVVTGDLDVYNNVTVGGIVSARLIRGRNAFCGLYANSTALNTYCPNPQVGNWALTLLVSRTPGDTSLGEVYICSTDGTWTDAGFTCTYAEFVEQLQAEAEARQAGDSVLQDNIDVEEANRQAADETLQNNINDEVTARSQGDTALGQRITQEIENRQQAIQQEAHARQEADEALGRRMTGFEEGLQNEAQTRGQADETLQQNINNEKENRQAADEELGRRMTGFEEGLQNEAQTRGQADETLQQNINNEKDERETGDQNLQLKLNEEKEARQADDYSLLTRFNKITQELQNQINGLNDNGVAVSNQFGTNPHIGISQKTLTEALNKIWEKIEDMTGEIIRGINMVVTPTFFVSENGCTIHIAANTVEANGIFEKIQFFIDNELIHEDTNTEYVSFDHHLDVKPAPDYTYVVMCKVKIMGVEYTRQQVITRYNEFFIGAGNTYTDILDSAHSRQLNGTMRHNYDVTFSEGDKLIIVMGATLRDGFIRADLNGVEIELNEQTVTIDGKQYVVLTSEPWSEGDYNIDING